MNSTSQARRTSLPSKEERKKFKQQLQKAASEPSPLNGASTDMMDGYIQTNPNPPTLPRPSTLSKAPSKRFMEFDSSNTQEEDDNYTAEERSLSPTSGLSVLGGKCEVGLDNLGNTCFMNSILQCLMHIRPLTKYFLLSKANFIKDQINPRSPTKGVLALSFAQLCRDIAKSAQNSDAGSITPKNFKKAVGAYAPHLLDYNQQDSHEFLRFLLNGMSEDLCRARVPVASETEGSSSRPTSQVTVDADTPDESDSAKGKTPEMDGESDSRPETSSDTSPPSPSSSAAGTPKSSPGEPRSRMSLPDKIRSNVALAHHEQAALGSEQDIPTVALQQLSLGSGNAPNAESEPNTTHKVGSMDVITSSATACLQIPLAIPAPAPLKSAAQEAAESWQRYVQLNDSLVTDIFAGQLLSHIQCQSCQYISRAFDPFLDLCVEIPRSDSKTMLQKALAFTDSAKCTLETCLQKFTGEEVLEGENMWRCDYCKEPRRAIKRLEIFRLPKILVISFNRFRWGSSARGESAKVNVDVTFPIEDSLDLGPYVSKESDSATSALYDLIGVSNHSGGMGGGHYIAHCDVNNSPSARARVSAYEAQWTCFNDSKVSKLKKGSSIGGPSAYLLFYQLRQADSSSDGL